jgi:two-component system response regulator AtoC
MENVIDRAMILAEAGMITLSDLPPLLMKTVRAEMPEMVIADSGDSLRNQVRRYEIGLITNAINDAGGDRRIAASKLGMGLSSLYRKLDEFDVPKSL